MAKRKTTFILDNNSAYPDQSSLINIIGEAPNDIPYVSITFQDEGNEIGHAWIKDRDLERFAVNILKALKSKYLKLLLLILFPLFSFSQKGRIRQTTTIVVWYEMLPDNGYDIYVRNAATDTSLIQVIYKDSSFTLRLGNWEKYHFRRVEPGGFTLLAKNITNVFGEWEECGSSRAIEKVGKQITKGRLITTGCEYIKQ